MLAAYNRGDFWTYPEKAQRSLDSNGNYQPLQAAAAEASSREVLASTDSTVDATEKLTVKTDPFRLDQYTTALMCTSSH